MGLDAILEWNQTWVRGRSRRSLPLLPALPVAVIACDDPRLDPLLPLALGFDREAGFLVRSAGARVLPAGDSLRSLVLAVFQFGVTDVLVVGHTSCRMADFDTSGFIAGFRGHGVPRDAFGSEDLRAWAGAFADSNSGVRASVDVLRKAPFLPRDLRIAGLVLDDATGALEVVVRADEVAATGAAVPPSVPAERPAVRAPAGPSDPRAAAEEAPLDVAFEDVADDLTRTIGDVRRHLGSLATHSEARASLERLRRDLVRERNPQAQLRLVEGFLRQAGTEAAPLAAAFDRLRREAADARGELTRGDLVELFRGASGAERP